MRPVKIALLLASLLITLPLPARAHGRQGADAAGDRVVNGSLAELRGKRRILLMVRRSSILDASGQGKEVLAEVYSQPEPRTRYPRTFNLIAKLFNKYMARYQSITAARSISEAEFIVFFNLLEIRRPLGTPYAYGEMYVILNERGEGRQPRIIWRARKGPAYAEDAAKELIKELKAARGEG